MNNNNNNNLENENEPQYGNSGSGIKSAVSGHASSLRTRPVAEGNLAYDTLPITQHMENMKMDIQPWINRPFNVGTVAWTTSNARFSNLAPPVTNLPRDVFVSNIALANMMKMAAYFKMKLCLNVSLTGTMVHQGTLVVAILPPSPDNLGTNLRSASMLNTYLSGPHAFLSANEASSVCLEVPWYCNTDLGMVDVGPYTGTGGINPAVDIFSTPCDYATFCIGVLNPLSASTGASTTLNVVVEAYFKELELYTPSPRFIITASQPPTNLLGESFMSKGSNYLDSITASTKKLSGDIIDAARGTLRTMTGLHNPNDATFAEKKITSFRNYANTVDSTTFIEKLDPDSTVDRITSEPIFGTMTDEMMIKNIVSKPQYLGTFQVGTNNNVGALCWSRPIAPWQGACNSGFNIANNIELLYTMTRAWKGDINIHIQSSMTNKHSLKLKLIKLYAPSTTLRTNYPVMTSLANAPSDLLEFSGGGQVQTVTLPYMSRTNLMYNSRANDAVPLLHGAYYIYVAQPLVIGDAVPTTVEFNVYMSLADNFQFYGYSTEVLRYQPAFQPLPTDTDPVEEVKEPYVGQSAEVMNEPQDQKELLDRKGKEIEINAERLVPLVDIRPLIRRFQKGKSGFLTINPPSPVTGPSSTISTISLFELITEGFDQFYRGSNGVIPAMFYGKHAGLKFKLKVSHGSVGNIYYSPPNAAVLGIGTVNPFMALTVADDNQSYFNELNESTFCLPFLELPTMTSVAGNSFYGSSVYEFCIPNTTIFKFIGSSNKLNSGAFLNNNAVADLGNLIVNYIGAPGPLTWTLYYAFTDESRLGFQTIAPIMQRPTFVGTPVNRYLTTPYSQYTNTTSTPGVINPTSDPRFNSGAFYYSNLTTAFT